MSDGWHNLLIYCPEAIILPVGAISGLTWMAVATLRRKAGAWLWRRKTWPRRLA